MLKYLPHSLVVLFFIIGCHNLEPDDLKPLSGKELAQIHCGSCHAFPEPNHLDKKSWENYVLPRMGYLLGIRPTEPKQLKILEEGFEFSLIKNTSSIADAPLLNDMEWSKIQSYYLDNSPNQLKIPKRPKIEKGLPNFRLRTPSNRLSPPSTTLVKMTEPSGLFIGDAHTKSLLEFSSDLSLQNAANVREGAVWLNDLEEEFLITVMGSFAPTDKPSGFVMSLPKNQKMPPQIIINNLQRPVHTTISDLNRDGLKDLVICEFGKWQGGLSYWQQKPNQTYEKHLLRATPGATKAYVKDFDRNGFKDIIALFSQGDEGIFIFYNEGNGNFREERVIQFPPSYGSSFFNLYDFNRDGYADIIHTAGDNADFSPLLKPYHGIRVFLNNGRNQFKQVFFYPLNGAYQAIPKDFDLDGDIDIAAISFFPDFQNHPEEGFIYLENQGTQNIWSIENFKAYSFPEVVNGRWIVADIGDLDDDRDIDLILGSLAFEVSPKSKQNFVENWMNLGIPFVVLENLTYD